MDWGGGGGGALKLHQNRDDASGNVASIIIIYVS